MTDFEIDAMIAQIDEMAQRIGCRFEPDPQKLAAFRTAERQREAHRAEWERRLKVAGIR